MKSREFEPKLFTIFRLGYTLQDFYKDLTAGVIVGIIALPLAIAFAIASGVKPEQGLYTAIIAGFFIAAFGGSRVQVSGPTGAFIVVIYGIVVQFGYNGLAIATILAGIILIVMGITRIGIFIKYIPYPVIIGFTAGIAVIIFSSQVKDFLGLQTATNPADFIEKWEVIFQSLTTINFYALGVGIFSIAIIIFFQKFQPKIPGTLAAILLATFVVWIFNLPVETIGSRFGSVPNHFPTLTFPDFKWSDFQKLISPALTIALLGAIESLLSAVVSDGMINARHRSNMELIGQGIGNILSPMFGGISATGAIARTAANVKSGGRTPVSAIIHALTLLMILLFLGEYSALIPLSSLAAILIIVAFNMSERQHIKQLMKSPRSDILVLLVTFLLTVLIDLTVAIQVGVLIAAILFIKRMNEVSQYGYVTHELRKMDEFDDDGWVRSSTPNIPDGVEVFELQGALFFGAVQQFKDAIQIIEKKPKILILRMRQVMAIDATGIHSLEELYESSLSDNMTLVISGIHSQPLFALEKAGLADKIKRENLLGNINEAMIRAKQILEEKGK